MSLALKRVIWLLLLVVMVFAALALVSARTRRISQPAAEKVSIAPAAHETATAQSYDAAQSQDRSNEEQVEVEVLTLEPHGFEPAQMTRPQGRFMLAITNHTQTNDLSLELKRQAGSRMHTVRMGRGQSRSLNDLNLPPGDYVLSETNHPRWTCGIRISAR